MEDLPSVLATLEFMEVWREWEQFRKSIRKKLTAPTIRRQIKRLESWGHDAAIASIEYSIEQGYQGLFDRRLASKPIKPGRVKAPEGKYTKVKVHKADEKTDD